MTAYLSLNGARVVSARITMPLYGAWVADGVLATADAIAQGVTLTVGSLSLKGTSFRMAAFSGSRSDRIVGGGLGWRKVLPARAYSHDAGVRLSQVLGDAARECGETIDVANDQVIGAGWARRRGIASRVLRRLVGGQWWIEPSSGITKLVARDASPIRSPFTVESWSGAKGLFQIATENYEDWLPGRTFTSPLVTGVQTISSVSLVADNEGKLRLSVLNSDTKEERIADQMRALIRDELAALGHAALVEYKVENATTTTIDASPADPSQGWPALLNVPLRSGLLGETVLPTVGSIAVIAFLNMDPKNFVCLHVQGTPVTAAIDASATVRLGAGALPVARGTDLAGGIWPIIPTQVKVLA